MILKAKDPQDMELQRLEKALKEPLADFKRRDLEKRLAFLRAGNEGEKEAAYHIDFHLKDAPNWMVIHDLRLEWNGRVAQIDHLLIGRLMEFYVVESKNLKTKVRYLNGGWERFQGNQWAGFPCPVEQNRRHILVLQQLIEEQHLAPVRLGVTMPASYKNVVVVNPACSIIGDFPKDVRVWRMDSLVREIRAEDRSIVSLLTVISSETLEAFARKILTFHKPASTEAVKPALEKPAKTETEGGLGDSLCEACGGGVTKEEAFFCRVNKGRFAGKTLCRKCQEYAPREKSVKEKAAQLCAQCCVAVDSKVVAFSRFNSKRFGGRILCRDCQKTVGA